MTAYVRPMVRCTVPTCRYTWSVDPGELARGEARCACGGQVEVIDIAAEAALLPHATKDEVEARGAGGIATLHPAAKK